MGCSTLLINTLFHGTELDIAAKETVSIRDTLIPNR